MRMEELNNFCEGCMPLKPACEEETADFRTQLHAHLKTPPTFLAQPERVRILTVVISGVIFDENFQHKSCSALQYAFTDVIHLTARSTSIFSFRSFLMYGLYGQFFKSSEASILLIFHFSTNRQTPFVHSTGESHKVPMRTCPIQVRSV